MADEIKKIHEELKVLRKAGKHEEFKNFLADGAIFMSPAHPPADAAAMAALRKDGKFEKFDKAETTHICDDIKVFGDIAIDRGSLKVECPNGAKEGNYLTVWTKVDGSWKILNSCTSMRIEMP